MKMKRYEVYVRETALKPRDKQRKFTYLEVADKAFNKALAY